MPLETLLMYAAGATWRHRWWWVFGLMATAGGLLTNLAFRGVSWYSAGKVQISSLDFQAWLEQFANLGALIGGGTAIFLLAIVLWLASAMAEGGLIVAVAARDHEVEPGLGSALGTGAGLLGRLIGIDSLLFLPLFLLAIALLVLGFGGLAGLVVAANRPGVQAADLLLVAVVTTGAGLALMLLMLVTGAVIMIMRALAFRATAMEGLSAVDSIRRSWALLRHSAPSIIALALVLAAIRSLVGLPLRVASGLALGLGWTQFLSNAFGPGLENSGLSMVAAVSGVALAFLGWLVSGVMNAFGSASWTVSYEKWSAEMKGD